MKFINFELKNTEGELIKFSDLKGKKIILFFYPKANTSGCTKEALMFKDYYKEILDLGAEVVGISKDSVKDNKKFKDNNDLPYNLLSDEDISVCEAYDVYKEKTMYGKKYMGIVRTTIIFDENQNIIKRFDNVKIKDHINDVLKTLK